MIAIRVILMNVNPLILMTLRVPYTQYGFLSRVACFWSCSCSQKKMKFLSKRAGFIVFPGLPLALLFYARALIGRTDGA